MTVDKIKALLSKLNFPSRRITEQTVFCVLALSDTKPRQGLLAGHVCLADGARIHDILSFVRQDIGHPVAENTRESYRKTSLRPLMEAGWVIRHQLSTNDPNTYYRLHPDFARLLTLPPGPERDTAMKQLRLSQGRRSRRKRDLQREVQVTLVPGKAHTLSPGRHNLLEKAVVETLAPALLQNPLVVYLGDTAPRVGYQDRTWMRRLNLPIDITVSLPDVILYDLEEQTLLVVEAVVSSGPISPARLVQLEEFALGPVRLGAKVLYVSAFLSRRIFRQFVEDIAWGSSAWIADEPYNIIHFVPLSA
jgi:hypothetical protein